MSSLFSPTSDTHLEIPEIGIVGGSSRGIRQSIEPVSNGQAYYDVFGVLHHTSRPALQRFRTTIMGEDVWAPAFGDLWYGMDLTISAACDIIQPVSQAPCRPVVTGSLRYLDAQSNVLPSSTGATHFAFRPILNVKVINWQTEEDEYGSTVAWTIECWERGNA